MSEELAKRLEAAQGQGSALGSLAAAARPRSNLRISKIANGYAVNPAYQYGLTEENIHAFYTLDEALQYIKDFYSK